MVWESCNILVLAKQVRVSQTVSVLLQVKKKKKKLISCYGLDINNLALLTVWKSRKKINSADIEQK